MTNKNRFLLLLSMLVVIIAGCGGQVSSSATSTSGGTENGTLYAGTAVLSWSAPTTYSDGNLLSTTNIKGYRVYSRSPSGAYNPGIYYYVSAPTTSVSVKNLSLPVGQYYFAVTTMDIQDAESNFSSEVSADLTRLRPSEL